MAFRPVSFAHLSRFNSSVSSKFLENYESCVQEALRQEAAEPPHRTFAPSSARCPRRSWFRIRGTAPDVPASVDATLKFTADIGTACHRIIQNNLSRFLGDSWIDVKEWIDHKIASGCFPEGYKLSAEYNADRSETLIEMTEPYPVRFACDGLVSIDGCLYLLEIKTSEFSSWDDLTDPKSLHIAQVEHYCALLGLSKVLFLYQDRQYGGLKCYEHDVSDIRREEILNSMRQVMECVDAAIPPPALEAGDKWCSPNMCPYSKKCKQWGR